MLGKMLVQGLVALALCLPAPPAAAAGDSHSHGGGHRELMLDHGRKWPTDGPLRQGMTEIRTVIAEILPQAHSGQLDGPGYAQAAKRVLDQVDLIVATCKLPADADSQLHLVLAEIIDGTERMTKGGKPVNGVVKILGGLDAYGKHFDHSGWTPLGH